MLVKYPHNTSATLPGFDTTYLLPLCHALLSLTCCTLSMDSLNGFLQLGLIQLKNCFIESKVNGLLFLSKVIFSDKHCDTGILSCEGVSGKSGNLSFHSHRCSLTRPGNPVTKISIKSERFRNCSIIFGRAEGDCRKHNDTMQFEEE